MDASEIFRKLKFDAKKKNLVINAPNDYKDILSGFTYDTDYQAANKNTYDFIQVFATSQSELKSLLANISNAGKYDCLFWICYPKGGGKIKSDLKRDIIGADFSIVNLRPVSQIAIDETWSALRGRPEEAVKKTK